MWKLWLALSLLAVLNGIDYFGFISAFDDGKTRYLLLSLVPISFWFFRPRLGWIPAFVGALALFSYVTHNYKPSHDTVLPILSIFACLALASALVSLGEELFGNLLIASGLVQGVIALLQWARAAHLLPFGFPHHATPDGLIGNNTTLAPFLVICLAPALWRGLWWAAIPIAAAVLACHSVGGLLCLSVLLLTQYWHPLALLVALPVLFAAAAWFGGHSLVNDDGRFFMWKFGWRAVQEHPWFGSGIGAWENIYLPRFETEILEMFHFHLPKQLHNDYLDFAVEYGLVPLGILVVGAGQWLLSFRSTWMDAVCLVLLVDAAISFPAEEPYLVIPFLICWGLIRRKLTNERIPEMKCSTL